MTNKIFLLNRSVKQKQQSPPTGAGGVGGLIDEGLPGVCQNSGALHPPSTA